MLRLSGLACILLGGLCDAQEPSLQIVKYDELKEVVLQNRGRVVVVELWADWCPSCKARCLPHLVQMHQRLNNKDVVVVTVALPGEDKPAEAVKGEVLRYLSKAKLPFINLLLDEKDAFWQAKFGILGPPKAYVFDRQGKWTASEGEDLDRLVEEVLK